MRDRRDRRERMRDRRDRRERMRDRRRRFQDPRKRNTKPRKRQAFDTNENKECDQWGKKASARFK